MVFFFVGNLIVAYESASQEMVCWTIGKLREKYQLSGGEPLQWFLRVEAIRDRGHHLI
jgi:hypothetical protein